jgi:hypothetical protein
MIDISQLLNIHKQKHSKIKDKSTVDLNLKNLLLYVPKSISSLPVNTYINGFVRDKSDEKFVIKTQFGELKVSSPINFNLQDRLSFVMVRNNNQIELQLVSVGDFEISSKNTIFRQSTTTLQTSTLIIEDDVNIINASNHTLKAQFILPKLEDLTKTISKLDLNETFMLGVEKLNNTSDLKNLLRTESILELKILNILPALLNQQEMPPIKIIRHADNSLQLIFSAIALEAHNRHEKLLKSSIGLLRLLTGQQDLPASAILEFEITSIKKPIPMQTLPLNLHQAMMQFSSTWPTMEQIFKLLPSSLLISKIIPSIGDNFVVAFSEFIQKIKSGNFKLDEEIKKILSQDEHLINNFTQDCNMLKELFNAQHHKSWYSFMLPIYDGSDMRQVNIYVRENASKVNENAKDSRVIIEINTEKFGAMQLDIFYKSKSIDLAVRSIKEIDLVEQENIILIFYNTLNISNFSGGISFIQVKEFPIKPLNEINKNAALTSKIDI